MYVEMAAFINAGINKELFAVTFLLERFTAMWTLKRELLQISFIRMESRITNLAFELASTTGVIINILIGGIADRA